MKRTIFTILVLTAAVIGQQAAKQGDTVKITLYYPGGTTETITLPENVWPDDWQKLDVKKLRYSISNGCITYYENDDVINFCGTFKVVGKRR